MGGGPHARKRKLRLREAVADLDAWKVMSYDTSDLSVPDLVMRDLLLQRNFSFDIRGARGSAESRQEPHPVACRYPPPGLGAPCSRFVGATHLCANRADTCAYSVMYCY